MLLKDCLWLTWEYHIPENPLTLSTISLAEWRQNQVWAQRGEAVSLPSDQWFWPRNDSSGVTDRAIELIVYKGEVSPLAWPTNWTSFLVYMEAIPTADVLLFCSYSATVSSASLLGEEVRTPALLRVKAFRHADTVPLVGIRGSSGFSCDVPFPSLVGWPWFCLHQGPDWWIGSFFIMSLGHGKLHQVPQMWNISGHLRTQNEGGFQSIFCILTC